MLQHYLRQVLARYGEFFCCEAQVLSKIKDLLTPMTDPDLAKSLKQLRKATTLRAFRIAVDGLS